MTRAVIDTGIFQTLFQQDEIETVDEDNWMGDMDLPLPEWFLCVCSHLATSATNQIISLGPKENDILLIVG